MAKLNYMQQVKVIQNELGCTFQEAKAEYSKRKDASDAKKDEKTPKSEVKKPAKADKPAKSKGVDPERAKNLEVVFNRASYSANRMLELAKEYLGENAKIHRNVNTPRECYFTCGDVRVPKNGVCIIKL